MRFEKLSYFEKKSFLERVYKKLNKELFNGELPNVDVIIENLDDNMDGCFTANNSFYDKDRISISIQFVERLEKLRTQKEQIFQIVCLLTHEMCHVYCSYNHLDDSNHSSVWQEVANTHGLEVCYENGVCINETARLALVIVSTRISIK